MMRALVDPRVFVALQHVELGRNMLLTLTPTPAVCMANATAAFLEADSIQSIPKSHVLLRE